MRSVGPASKPDSTLARVSLTTHDDGGAAKTYPEAIFQPAKSKAKKANYKPIKRTLA